MMPEITTEGPDLSGKRIVVVEDDFLIASDICDALRKRGATVLGPAPTPFYAEHLIGSRRIDGAILDVRLHGTNVFEVADNLMRRGVAVVFATASEQEDLPLQFRAAPYMQKPFNTDALMATVEEMIRFPPRIVERPVPSFASADGERSPSMAFAATVARQLRRPSGA